MNGKKLFTRYWPILILAIFSYFLFAIRTQWVAHEQAALAQTYHRELKQQTSRELDRLFWAVDSYFNKVKRRDQYGMGNSGSQLELLETRRTLVKQASPTDRFTITQIEADRFTVEKELYPWHYEMVLGMEDPFDVPSILGVALFQNNSDDIYTGVYSDAYRVIHDVRVESIAEEEMLFMRYDHGRMEGELVLALDTSELHAYLAEHRRAYDRAAMVCLFIAAVVMVLLWRKWKTPLEVFEKGLVALATSGDTRIFELATLASPEVASGLRRLGDQWVQTIDDKNAKTARLEYLEQQGKRQEQSLREMEEKLARTLEELTNVRERNEQLIGHIEDLLWVIDASGKITYINEASTHLLGRSPGTLIGERYDALLVLPEDIQAELFERALSNQNLRFIGQEGRIEKMMTTTTLLKEGDAFSVQGVSRPIYRSRTIGDMLDKKKLELNTLGQINSSLINRWTLSELLDSVVERLDQLYPVEICTIRLLCEEEDVLLLKASSGRLKEHVLEGEIPLRGDVLETCLREKRMVHIRDFEMGMLSAYDDNLLQFQQDPEGVFIPLENEGRIIGLLTLIVGDRLSGENLEIFKTFGLQVSLAIERTRTYEKLKEEYFKTLEVMIAAIEAKDEYTKGHSRRVARVASLLARQLDYTDEEIEMVETAGLLHDIGKIGVPDAVLTKKGKLEAQEYELMKQHPLLGEAILAPIGLPETVVDGIRYHHKRYDGTGYPEERQIERLDPISEIIGVADAFDAMTSKRSYTANRTIEEAMDELIRCAGSQFSPLVVKAMVSLIEEEKPKIEKAMEDEDSV